MRYLTVFFVFISIDFCCASAVTDSLKFATIESGRSTYKWYPEWNTVIADAIEAYGGILLDTEKVPMDQLKELCPEFSNADRNQRKAFWVLVIAAMAKYESNFNPNTRYKEGPPLNTYSEGLLQLSYGDEKRYSQLPIDPAKQNILDPAVNLTSGIIILAKQIKDKKILFTTKSYYWSVLTKKQKEIKAFIKDHIDQLDFCNSN
jgi:hypothetical protein